MRGSNFYTKLKQYWSYEIKATAITAVAIAILLYIGSSPISELPRSSMALMATILSTLLGLTLTAFSILIAFMRNFTIDFLETNTFLNIGRLFRLIMVVELVSLIVSVVTYVAYSTKYHDIGLFLALFTASLSLTYFWILLNRTFTLFRIARDQIINNH